MPGQTSQLAWGGVKMNPGLSHQVIAGGAKRHPRHIGSSHIGCARGGAGGGAVAAILSSMEDTMVDVVIDKVNCRRGCVGAKCFFKVRFNDQTQTQKSQNWLCANAFSLMKTLSQTPRPIPLES